MKKIITSLVCLLFIMNLSVFGQEPEQDCENALPVCIGIYYQENSYEGEGYNDDEINPANSCLSSGERNSVWYKFSIVSSGDLGFTITPNVLTEDYDWAVYDVTELRCFDIYDTPEMEVSCNYSGTSGVTGATGPPNSSTSQGAGGTNQNAYIPVEAGQQYILNVSNFTSSTNGYTLDLTLSTATVTGPLQEVNITNVSGLPEDTINPVCGTNEMVVFFDLLLNCDLLDGESFSLTDDAGNEYSVVDIDSDCEEIGDDFFSEWFTLTLDQNFEAGAYQLVVYNSDDNPTLIDICGNKAKGEDSDTLSIDFVVDDLADLFSITAFPVDCKGGNDGTIIVNTPSEYPEDYFGISWSNGDEGDLVSNLEAGIYTAEIGNGDCILTETVEITEPEEGMELLNVESTTSCANNGTGSATVAIEGGEMPYEYELNGISQDNPVFENLAPGLYQGIVIDDSGCELDFEVSVEAIEGGMELLNVESNGACGSNGSATVSIEGGEMPYEYELNGVSQDNPVFENLAPGTYQGVATDDTNCELNFEVTVEEFAFSGPAIENDSITICDTGEALNLVSANLEGNNTFEWTGPNGFTSNEAEVEVSEPIAGEYTLTVESENGCTTSGTVIVGFMECIVESVPTVEVVGIKVYPNPTKDYVFIENTMSINANHLVQIYDVQGSKIKALPLSQNMKIDLKALDSGMYFVRICGDDLKEEKVFKIVKE